MFQLTTASSCFLAYTSEWVEALGWYQQEDKNNVTGTGKEWFYHWKADELLRVNPSALVPTLMPIVKDSDGKNVVQEDKAVFESLVTIDYIDAVSGANGKDCLNPLHDPFWAAHCRIWADKVNRDCCSPYYGVLVRQKDEERREHFDKLVHGLKQFASQLRKTKGPIFLPDSQLSNVDLALIPWAFRYYVLEHYRGVDYKIPLNDELLEPYHEWFDYVMNLPSVQRTLPDKDRYLEHIMKYADGSARSKVANAVRRGVAAHELDDEKDEY